MKEVDVWNVVNDELETDGFGKPWHGETFSRIWEMLFMKLYSSLSCAVAMIKKLEIN